MTRKEIREYQLAQLELLKRLDVICNRENIKYYLAFGTLLGAVRHKGFIPWDIDIDVVIPRSDYEHLRQYFSCHNEENIFYDHYDTNEIHVSPHALLRIVGTHVIENPSFTEKYHSKHDGIYIDLFPIDNVPNDEKLQKEQVKRIATLRRIVGLKRAKQYGDKTTSIKKVLKNMLSIMLCPYTFRNINKRMDRVFQQYNGVETKNVAILTDPALFEKQKFSRSIFQGDRKIVFEGWEFPVPYKAEEFLTQTYGEYMKLPPEEERWGYLENEVLSIDYGIYKKPIKL